MKRCVAPNILARVPASSTSLVFSPPSNPIVNVRTGPEECLLMMASSAPESMPELRKSPSGTSLRSCSRTASSSRTQILLDQFILVAALPEARHPSPEPFHLDAPMGQGHPMPCGSFRMPLKSVFGEGTYRNVNSSASASTSTSRGQSGSWSRALISDANRMRLPRST